MKLADFIDTNAVVPQLTATERNGVIAELVDALVASGAIDAALRDDLVKKITDRESKGSTGFGKGVAVPHVKHPKLEKMVGTVGVSPTGVDFNALDKAAVYSVVLLLSPEDKPDDHLQAMENIFRNLQNETFRRFLRQATSQQDIEDLIAEADNHQLA
jgi:PTS system fructose-specific IIA component/PTS system nitrogen regulatory IIA component